MFQITFDVTIGNCSGRSKNLSKILSISLLRDTFSSHAQLTIFVSNCYGSDPNGKSPRTDLGEEGRFRCFSREEITERGENLDISWLRDESLQSAEDLPEPDEIAAEIMMRLQTAMEDMEALTELLEAEN